MLRKGLALARAAVGGVVVALSTVLFGTTMLVIARFRPSSPVIDRLTRGWARVFLLMGWCRLEVEGRERIVPGRSYVFVANHLSDLDIPVNFLSVKPASIRFLAKRELFRVPILGPIMRGIGIVETDRRGGVMALDSINTQIEYTISLGHSLMIYPEGTRARDGNLHEFKKGAFRIAIDNGMDVVPMSLTGTFEAWPPDTPFVYGGKARVVVHEPIPVAGLGVDDVETLRDRAYRAVAAGLEQLTAS